MQVRGLIGAGTWVMSRDKSWLWNVLSAALLKRVPLFLLPSLKLHSVAHCIPLLPPNTVYLNSLKLAREEAMTLSIHFVTLNPSSFTRADGIR